MKTYLVYFDNDVIGVLRVPFCVTVEQFVDKVQKVLEDELVWPCRLTEETCEELEDFMNDEDEFFKTEHSVFLYFKHQSKEYLAELIPVKEYTV